MDNVIKAIGSTLKAIRKSICTTLTESKAYTDEKASDTLSESKAYTDEKATSGLPEVSVADNGKFMRVSNGAWAAETVPNAEEASF